MPPIIWIDGTYYDRASAKVSVFDHGLLYGDGVFEGIAAGVDEVIMLDAQGYVAEASGMNLFAVTNGTLKTPPAYAGILRGVTRDAVIELAREATYGVEELPLNRYDLYTADEMFLTGTAAEVVSVTKLDGRVIGHGQPGPITKELAKRFKALAIRGD